MNVSLNIDTAKNPLELDGSSFGNHLTIILFLFNLYHNSRN